MLCAGQTGSRIESLKLFQSRNIGRYLYRIEKKKEAVQAAEAARGLAELETSKIIKLADALVARAKAL